jgi:hypothetical protein
MKAGDLVRYGSTTPDNRTPIQKVCGVVVSDDGVMLCSHAVEVPYKMGTVEVLWADARGIERETYSSLEVINESR